MSPLVTILEGFNRHGIFCGYARLHPDGRWLVSTKDLDGDHVEVFSDNEQSARMMLEGAGAATIREGDGLKR